MNRYGKLISALIAAWFMLAVSASALHLFTNRTNGIGLGVGLAAMAPIVIFWLWFAISNGFREFLLSLNPRVLTYVQSGLILGIVFVISEARGILPAIFALPAGYGDMLVGATASFAAWKLATRSNRGRFIRWQALGIVDLVVAVSLGTTAGFINPHGIPTAVMTVLPLSLIPTFLVPLYFILHVICIVQASSWKGASGDIHQGVKRAQDFVTDGFRSRQKA